jgi:hypothetical protein
MFSCIQILHPSSLLSNSLTDYISHRLHILLMKEKAIITLPYRTNTSISHLTWPQVHQEYPNSHKVWKLYSHTCWDICGICPWSPQWPPVQHSLPRQNIKKTRSETWGQNESKRIFQTLGPMASTLPITPSKWLNNTYNSGINMFYIILWPAKHYILVSQT